MYRQSYRWKASEVWQKVNWSSLNVSHQTKVLKRHSSVVPAVRTAEAANDDQWENENLEKFGLYINFHFVIVIKAPQTKVVIHCRKETVNIQ